ncbi:Alg9-like mannosyltransferase family-domain-containing protein [Syncephalastrum racemosum]|uniref:Mannosyltransferase n=1 Tax=Syncephalastrum racemosum TaxID=13706 RepID=A0A1X2HBH4_SYNRA|nr:Alg9-like mannosyltransferase family-domain-containing protein [Syncephalastrum racemosum]
MKYLVFLFIALYCLLCPYTKVEESFNIQATHDILHHGLDLQSYDHQEFPGVVPRTFLGSIILALPLTIVTRLRQSLLTEQILARLLLGGSVSLALAQLSGAIRKLLGAPAATAFVLLSCCQFHLIFWSSRTLPNTFALPLVLLGLSEWIRSLAELPLPHLKRMIYYLTAAGVIFRFEAGIFLAILVATEWFLGRISLATLLLHGFIMAMFCLTLTVGVDSFFWGYWLWPEGCVFYFNAILNKSSEWGTMPFYSYFVLFLPRLLMVSYPLAALAFVCDTRVRRLLFPALVYIGVFSALPHKEWRFIMYTIPLFTAAAASLVGQLWIYRRRSWLYCISLLAIIGGALLSLAGSGLLVYISSLNYPGGHALSKLHMVEEPSATLSVHMDVLTAMTGATRFGEHNPQWSYHKNESHVTSDDFIEAGYTHLITHTDPAQYPEFEIMDEIKGLDSVRLRHPRAYLELLRKEPSIQHLIPIDIRITTKLYTLKLKNPQKTWIQFMLRKHPVLLFSKTYWYHRRTSSCHCFSFSDCSVFIFSPFCKRAKRILDRHCGSYPTVEVNLRSDSDAIKQALYEISGQQTFPNLFVDGKSLGGSDKLAALEEAGELGNLLSCAQK